MSKLKTSERDAAKEALAAMMASASAPGVEQAQRAVQQSDEPKEETMVIEPNPTKADSPKAVRVSTPKVSKVSTIQSIPKQKLTENGASEGKAEKISISLHPADLDRLENVENALRRAGLVGRGSPTSFLLKVALAAFDPTTINDLAGAVTEVIAQDGRRK